MIVSSRPNPARRPGQSQVATRRRLLAAVAGTVVALGLGTSAQADVKAGVDAWAKGDFATAVHEWEGPAAHGDADAAFDLGQAYKLGRGVPQDLARAEALFGQAAAQGHIQAADNYGLLLFQHGDHTRAMPYVAGAAGRGDPRAEYLMGIAYFNGDVVGKDWVRAYAFENLAQEAGLQQAKAALAQMDSFIPLEQRQQAVALKAELSQQIEGSRNRQVASLQLGNTVQQGNAGLAQAPAQAPAPAAMAPAPPANPYSGFPASAPQQTAMADNTPPAARQPPAFASPPQRTPSFAQNFAQPHAVGLPPRPVDLPRKHAHPAPVAPGEAAPAQFPAQSPPQSSAVATADAPNPASPPVHAAAASHAALHADSGPWKIQLGAFGVEANAEALWAKAKSRPEIAGHPRAMVPAGKVSRLLATGYSEQGAHAACAHLTTAGLACLVTKD